MPKFISNFSSFISHLSFSQRGFSALGLFLLGLALLILMSATGFFIHPVSPVTDTTVYKTTGAKTDNSKQGLHMIDLNFETPTPSPQPTSGPIPTQAPIPTSAPVPTQNYCAHDAERINCVCNPNLPIGLYCNGNLPPAANPTCNGDTTLCQEHASEDPSCHWYCLGKPVIYLYPTHPMFVEVTVNNSQIVESIPKIENGLGSPERSGGGWNNVFALPGGILQYQNNYYRELYYESAVQKVIAPDNGLFIKSENLQQDLKNQAEKLGLLTSEADEFVAYWLPRLQQLHKPYIFFSILSKEEKERTDHVEISPKPDTFIEFIAYFKGVHAPFETNPFVSESVPHRTGFTAVEWGGVIDSK